MKANLDFHGLIVDTVIPLIVIVAAWLTVLDVGYRCRAVEFSCMRFLWNRCLDVCHGARVVAGFVRRVCARIAKSYSDAYWSSVTCNGYYCHDSLGNTWKDDKDVV